MQNVNMATNGKCNCIPNPVIPVSVDTLECRIIVPRLYTYLFHEKCHPIRNLFGTILLLNLSICASLYSPIIVANYAGYLYKSNLPIASTNQSSTERTTVVNLAGSRASEDPRF